MLKPLHLQHSGLFIRMVAALVPAFLLFAFLFLRSGGGFWFVLPLSVVLLCAIAWRIEPREMSTLFHAHVRRHAAFVVGGGILSAAVLYGVFFVGNQAARHLLPFGEADIEAVYQQGSQTPRWIVATLLLLIVGPGEEIFWRGYVQRRLSAAMHPVPALVLSVLAYTGVHLATGNFTLILAAAVCGTFWSLLYQWFGSIWMNIISHALWAAAIFVWWPMHG